MSHIRPKKSLGQHFLTDKTVARRIVSALDPQVHDIVLEIGPGEGVLTDILVGLDCQLIAIDLDPESCALLESRHSDRVTILNQDILSVDLKEIYEAHGSKPIRIIGNIPYYITAPILFHLIDNRQFLGTVVLMIQKEVAERIVATPRTKEYGILSVVLQTVARVKKLFNVSAGSFHPRPKVMSSVICVEFESQHDIDNIEKFHRQLVRSAFGKRRKTLNNAIADLIPDKDERSRIFTTAGIDRSRRAEELTTEEFAKLARVFAHARTSHEG